LDLLLVGLHAGVFAATMLQAATGIGFGIIAGPLLLIVMDSASAVQVSILLSLFISAVIVPTLRKSIDVPLLIRLAIGSFAGLALGIYLFLQVDLDTLKILAGIVVLFMAFSVWRSGTASDTLAAGAKRHGPAGDFATGILSGAMTTSLAMPGPPVASRLLVLARPRDVVRATILALFVVSYSAAFLVQSATAGVDKQTLIFSAQLLPATALGLVAGRGLAGKFSEAFFRRLISAILLVTAIALLINSASGLVSD
jgi:uncharacterized membrane protein YfcA